MGVKHYDVIVIGGGPGGYTAALYCARSGRSVAVLEKLSAGGQMATTDRIDNYPGFEEGIDGFELGERMERQAWRFGVSTVYGEVRSVELAGRPKRIESTEGSFEAEAVILATGAFPRELGLPDEQARGGVLRRLRRHALPRQDGSGQRRRKHRCGRRALSGQAL